MPSISRKYLWIIGASLALVVFWEIVATIIAKDILLPTPRATVMYLFHLWQNAETWFALAASLRRLAIAFTINIVSSLILGIVAGFIERFEFVIQPLVAVMKSIPTMGIILLSLIWFNSEMAVLFVCTLIVFPVLYSSVLTGVKHIDSQLWDVHRIFRIPRMKALKHFIVPSIRPYLIAGLMSGLGLSMKVIIAAEVLSQPRRGIGTMFQIERTRVNTVGVFAWSLLVILLTTAIDWILNRIQKRYGQ